MEERASGIILRTRPLTETSLIVQWLTRDQGRISCVAKGARRPKSPFSGKLDLFYEADFSFVRSRKSELHTLREISLHETHSSLRKDLLRLQSAAYFAILTELATERETPLPEFYDLVQEALIFLDEHPPSLAFIFSFEAKILGFSGVTPSTENASTGAQIVFEKLAAVSLQDAAAVAFPLTGAVIGEISIFFRRAIGISFEKVPAQRERLFQEFSILD